MPKAKIDKDACISCGLCTGLVPTVFKFDNDEKAAMVNEDGSFPAEDDAAVKEAADQCPTSAIIIK